MNTENNIPRVSCQYHLEKINKDHGYHFFDENTMRGFCSKIYPEMYQYGKYVVFLSSERARIMNRPRHYTVRVMDVTTGSVGDYVAKELHETTGMPEDWLPRFGFDYYSSRNGQLNFYHTIKEFLKQKQNERPE